jgi:hypothetical protein
MTGIMEEREREDLERDALGEWKRTANTESVLRLLRERGLNQPESLSILMNLSGMDLRGARDAIVRSQTWADQCERNVRIQGELEQALLELSGEELPAGLIYEKNTRESEP